MVCLVPQSDAEALDRLTITGIKREMAPRHKRAKFVRQFDELVKVTRDLLETHGEPLRLLVDKLERINQVLWKLEDQVRRVQDVSFPAVARDIFAKNDERAAIKRDIDELTKSDLSDDKLRAGQEGRSPLFVLSHMGLGDMLAFAGAVFHLCAERPEVVLACKKQYVDTALHLFKDLDNLKLAPIDGDPYEEGAAKLQQFVDLDYDTLPLGYHSGQTWRVPEVSWLTSLYRQAGVAASMRYENFPVVIPSLDADSPEVTTMQSCLDAAGVRRGQDYAFVHDDPDRGYDLKYDGDLPIVRPGQPHRNLFDYALLLQEAAELHVIDSSFAHLADLQNPPCPKFLHTYARTGGKEARLLFGDSPSKWTFVDA